VNVTLFKAIGSIKIQILALIAQVFPILNCLAQELAVDANLSSSGTHLHYLASVILQMGRI
jgi:hypothetical protein